MKLMLANVRNTLPYANAMKCILTKCTSFSNALRVVIIVMKKSNQLLCILYHFNNSFALLRHQMV